MLKSLKKRKSLIAASAMAAIMVSCTPPPNTTDPGGDEIASISGVVTTAEGTPADNATIVLIRRQGGNDSDFSIERTNSNGQYSFNDVPAGNYRVAYVIQSQQERENGTPIAYDPDGKTGSYYGAITTERFDYDGALNRTFQVPQFNVGWSSGLSPHNEPVDDEDSIRFNWSQPPNGTNVEYNVLIKDPVSDNQVHKSPNISASSWTWDDPDAVLEDDKEYWYIVNVIFPEDNSQISLLSGNSPNGIFTTD